MDATESLHIILKKRRMWNHPSHLLFSVINRSCFSYNVNLDLSRIFKLRFNLLADIPGQKSDSFVAYFIRLGDDSDFSAGLNSE